MKNRLGLKFYPDVVYTTSFFTHMADRTTKDLSVGSVHLNIVRFKQIPIRYILRAADENITFATSRYIPSKSGPAGFDLYKDKARSDNGFFVTL
ncbi:unnamed protein product [Tilletia laevis]|nr:unnamed protein product [Tilletia laevis]CAD6974184.1 unnamed protein product [Tilletia controversa]